MFIKVSVNRGLNLKIVSSLKSLFFSRGEGEIHYIGGHEVLPPPLEAYEESCAIEGLGTDMDKEARNILIEHNLRLVVYIAKKFDNTGIGVEDLISIGTIGLIKGINSFKPEKGARLSTYVSRCIDNALLTLRNYMTYSKQH